MYPDLEELDTYGGGDDAMVGRVAGLMYHIQQKLAGNQISEKIRRQLLEEVIPFIKSGNAGLDDSLYDLA